MKVVFPIDSSEQSLYTIKIAANFLDKEHSEIYLITIEEPSIFEFEKSSLYCHEILHKAEFTSQIYGLSVLQSIHRKSPDPAMAICQYADEIRVDLIIIGSHGQQGLARFIMGSTSEKVLKESNRPVIIVRNDQSHSIEVRCFDKIQLQNVN